MPTDGIAAAVRTILLVAEDAQAHAVEQVAVISGLNVTRMDFADAVRVIDEEISPAVACVDVRGGTSAMIAALPGIVDVVDMAGLPLVVAFDEAQLEEVGGLLVGSRASLLCGTDPVELAGALAVAIADPEPMVRESSREAERLQRLSEEVARFAATLAKLTAQDDGEPGDRTDPFVAENEHGYDPQPGGDVDPADLRRAIRARRLREDVFDLPGLFEDPAWDMLLDLFAAELERRRVSVSSLCIAAAVAPTTALRWIGKLIEAGLLERRPDDFDRRRAFISLTPRASKAMHNYIAAMRRAGLNFA